jgi:hypothetical protein
VSDSVASCLSPVEALQFLKCLIWRDLVFHADPSVTVDSEVDLEDDDDSLMGSSNQLSAGTKNSLWDDLWLEDVGDAVTDG